MFNPYIDVQPQSVGQGSIELTRPHSLRIGMHLLFYGALQKKMLQMDWLQNLLKEQSIKVCPSCP